MPAFESFMKENVVFFLTQKAAIYMLRQFYQYVKDFSFYGCDLEWE